MDLFFFITLILLYFINTRIHHFWKSITHFIQVLSPPICVVSPSETTFSIQYCLYFLFIYVSNFLGIIINYVMVNLYFEFFTWKLYFSFIDFSICLAFLKISLILFLWFDFFLYVVNLFDILVLYPLSCYIISSS